MHVVHRYKHSPASQYGDDSKVSFLRLSTSRSPSSVEWLIVTCTSQAGRCVAWNGAALDIYKKKLCGFYQEQPRDTQLTPKVLEGLRLTESLFSEKTRNDSAAREYVEQQSGRREARPDAPLGFLLLNIQTGFLPVGVKQVSNLIGDGGTDFVPVSTLSSSYPRVTRGIETFSHRMMNVNIPFGVRLHPPWMQLYATDHKVSTLNFPSVGKNL